MRRFSPRLCRAALAGALALGASAGAARASTPILPTRPDAQAGDWMLSDGTRRCPVTLGVAPAALGGWVIAEGRDCLERLGVDAVAWRLESDGLALVAADGSTVAFLALRPGGTYAAPRPGRALVLTRCR